MPASSWRAVAVVAADLVPAPDEGNFSAAVLIGPLVEMQKPSAASKVAARWSLWNETVALGAWTGQRPRGSRSSSIQSPSSSTTPDACCSERAPTDRMVGSQAPLSTPPSCRARAPGERFATNPIPRGRRRSPWAVRRGRGPIRTPRAGPKRAIVDGLLRRRLAYRSHCAFRPAWRRDACSTRQRVRLLARPTIAGPFGRESSERLGRRARRDSLSCGTRRSTPSAVTVLETLAIR
jgi:hypothetical protein